MSTVKLIKIYSYFKYIFITSNVLLRKNTITYVTIRREHPSSEATPLYLIMIVVGQYFALTHIV